MGERRQIFTVVVRHAKFNNADPWDVQTVDVGESAKLDPAVEEIDKWLRGPAEKPAED